MKLVATIKLLPTPDQASALRRTLERCNAACDWLSVTGHTAGKVRQYDLQKLAYADCKAQFGLTAQAVIRCIAKVADAYKVGPKDAVRSFRPLAAQPYDDRILRFAKDGGVNLWTVDGRMTLAVQAGERQRDLLAYRKGECDLMLVRGKWFLACTCDVPEGPEFDPEDWLGVDLGIKNIAVDSDGQTFAGGHLNGLRHRHHRLRQRLQKKGTKSARRLLKARRQRESRFAKDINHRISKAIVRKAEGTRRGIALEDLKGIRERVTVRRSQRRTHHGWAFRQLRVFIEYKAKVAGVALLAVDPRNTSRMCPCCGMVDRKNRKSRDDFLCIACGLAGPADAIAARNISGRAVVMRPYAVPVQSATASCPL